MTRVGIVGAGISGLALTHFLAERGVETATIEASGTAGGVIRSTREAGTVLEHGPQRFRVTERMSDLIDEFDLRGELRTADDTLPLYVYVDGRLRRVPKSISGFVSTDLLSVTGKARALMEPFTASMDPDETVARAFERKFGREVATNIVDPLVGGIYAADTHALPVRHATEPLLRLESREGTLLRPALRRMWNAAGPPPATFRSGLQTLPTAIAARYPDRITVGEEVTDIESGTRGYRLRGTSSVVDAETVVLTPPASVAGSLLDGVAPDAAGVLTDLTYSPLAVVHLRADIDRRGFGYQIRADQGLRTLGVTWNAGLFGRDGVYTCFLGGMRDPGIVDESDGEIGAIAREDFTAVMGEPAEVLNVTTLREALPAYDRSWDALDGLDLPDGIHLCANYVGRLGIPGRIRAAERLASVIE